VNVAVSDGAEGDLIFLGVQIDDELLDGADKHDFAGINFRFTVVYEGYGIASDDWKGFFEREHKKL
jgi:hypothetical protein